MKSVTPLKAVVLLSGSGTTFQNLLDHQKQGVCAINILGVLSSRQGVFGIQRARIAGIPTQVVNRREFMDARAFSDEVFKKIAALKPDILVMAGFTSLLVLPERYIGQTINIHPSLLPKHGGKGMWGLNVHEAVLKSGDRQSGCTVHFVDNEYDHGPVILQKTVPVEKDDTPEKLQARVQLAEREAFPEAINMLADGRVRYEDGKAVFGR